VAAARNRGVEEASGRWIAFLDDDDLWSPAKLVEQLQAASRQQADGVYSGAVAVDSQLNVVMAIPARSPGEVIERITTENVLATGQSNLLVRRELVRQLGGFDVNLSLLADWELWIRLVAAGRLAACPAIHVAYVMHHDNMSLVDRGAGREFEYVAGRHMPDRATRRRARISNSRWHAYNLRRSRHRLLAAREYLGTAITCLSVPMGIRAIGAVLDGRAISALRGHPPRPEVPWLERYHGVHAPIPATLPTLSASDTPQTQDDRQPR
jgi:glycosyltransferase involved in cell wall biosynthesis